MPISFEAAKRKVWEIISKCPPDKGLIEFHCLEEDVYTFVSALTLPDIQALIKERKLQVDIVPDEPEEIEYQRQYVIAQYSLIVAAKTLSNYTDITTERWLQQLYTHAYNKYVNNEPEIAGILSEYYPVTMLDYDPIADQLAEKREVNKTQSMLQDIVRSDEDKTTVQEVSKLFDKLTTYSIPIAIVIDLLPAFILVGTIQLSLRHPNTDQEMMKSVKDIALKLIDKISEAVPDARKYLEMGWHTEFDKGEL